MKCFYFHYLGLGLVVFVNSDIFENLSPIPWVFKISKLKLRLFCVCFNTPPPRVAQNLLFFPNKFSPPFLISAYGVMWTENDQLKSVLTYGYSARNGKKNGFVWNFAGLVLMADFPIRVQKKKKLVELSIKRLTPPPPPVGKNKIKNDLRAMNRILYDMGPPTLVRWPLYRALGFDTPFGPGSKLRSVSPPKDWKK